MLAWSHTINSIKMNHGYISTSLKIVQKRHWLKTKDRKHHLLTFEKMSIVLWKTSWLFGKNLILKQREFWEKEFWKRDSLLKFYEKKAFERKKKKKKEQFYIFLKNNFYAL